MNKRIILAAAFAACAGTAAFAAAAPAFSQSLDEALKAAKERSADLKAAGAQAEAARRGADAARAALYPNLSVQGYQFYQTRVPSIDFGGLGSFSFGTHDNYAVGPVLSYTLFDGGRDRGLAQSAALLAKARDAAAGTQEQLLALAVRQAYFRVQYALRQVSLTADLYRLSSAQSKDIDLRFREGSSSKLDQVQAHRDLTANALRFQQAQNDLAAAFRDLAALIGAPATQDASFPIPGDLAANYPEGLPAPTLRITLDPLDATLAAYRPKSAESPLEEHLEVRALRYQADSSKAAARSERAGLWPTVALQAREQYEYPYAVLHQSVWQGQYGATLSVPVFEGGASRERAAQRASEAKSYEYQRDQRATDLTRFAAKASDALASLKGQRDDSLENVRQAQEVERLTYDSYKAGQSRYLDVQDANARLLQAQVAEAQLESAILNQTALVEYLSAR